MYVYTLNFFEDSELAAGSGRFVRAASGFLSARESGSRWLLKKIVFLRQQEKHGPPRSKIVFTGISLKSEQHSCCTCTHSRFPFIAGVLFRNRIPTGAGCEEELFVHVRGRRMVVRVEPM